VVKTILQFSPESRDDLFFHGVSSGFDFIVNAERSLHQEPALPSRLGESLFCFFLILYTLFALAEAYCRIFNVNCTRSIKHVKNILESFREISRLLLRKYVFFVLTQKRLIVYYCKMEVQLWKHFSFYLRSIHYDEGVTPAFNSTDRGRFAVSLRKAFARQG